jgi:hypothetical protein
VSSEIRGWKVYTKFGHVLELARTCKRARVGGDSGEAGEGVDEGEEHDKKEKDHRTASGRRVDGAAGPDSSSYRSGERDSMRKERKRGDRPQLPGLNEARRGAIYMQMIQIQQVRYEQKKFRVLFRERGI